MVHEQEIRQTLAQLKALGDILASTLALQMQTLQRADEIIVHLEQDLLE